MKRNVLFILILMAITACNNNQQTAAGNETDAAKDSSAKTETPAAPMDTATMNKAMRDFATPGKMHEWLASFNGTWEASVIGFMDPTKPDTSKATQTYGMSLNGLYQEGKFTGDMMGMPFEGKSVMGFDNAKKQFVSTWIDNLGSGIILMTGTYDEATKTMNLKGTQTNPMTGKDGGIREEMKIIDADNYVLDMYGDGPDGKEMKFMSGTFKRKKK